MTIWNKAGVALAILLAALAVVVGLMGPVSMAQATTVTFTAGEFLGKPTNDSITINVIPAGAIQYYYRYGTSAGVYTGQSATADATAGQPSELTITGLSANTKYYYQMVYDGDGSVIDGDFETRTEHSFQTARAKGNSFVFSVTSDWHGSGTAVWTDILGEASDFDVDLGDTFMIDGAGSQTTVDNAYKNLRGSTLMGKIGVSSSIFLASGNHEDEEGWNLDDTPFSIGVASIQARKAFFPTPTNGGFYTGNTDPLARIDEATYGDELREDYYAWTWGDALFVVIDEYQYTMNLPYAPGAAGEGTDDSQTGDQWSWTLGRTQYDWLKSTLENSDAKYKFVFSHNMLGGINRTIAGTGAGYVRGGAEAAAFYEWGGKNASGDYIFDTKRPGWGEPIHQLFVENGVSAYFHGHDHQFAYETREGVVYQEVPSAGGMGSGFSGIYTQGNVTTGVAAPYNTIKVIASGTGHLKIAVTSAKATVSYISSGGSNAYSYDILPPIVGTTHDLTMQVSPGGGGTTDPSVGTHTYDEDAVVDISATPAAGYVFSNWTGGTVDDPNDPTTTVTMDADKTVTANFVAQTYDLTMAVSPSGGGTTTPAVGTASYVADSVVGITATPAVHYFFSSWTGAGVADPNSASTTVIVDGDKTVTANFVYDDTAPTVTVNKKSSQADPTNATPIQFTVTFNEAVSGFSAADLSFTGSTTGGTLAGVLTPVGSDNTTWTVAVSGMSHSGDVTVSLASGAAQDAAGNQSAASTSTDNTVTYDNAAPTVTIDQAAGQADPTNASPINFTVVFSEAVSNFATGDVAVTGTASGTKTATVTGSGTTYNVAVTGMTGSGTVIASIAAGVASDAAGNNNAASTTGDNSVTYDNVAPTATIDRASGQADPTNATPIQFTVVFSEAVTGFTNADVHLAGTSMGGSASVAPVGSDNTTWTVAVSGMTDGTVSASIVAGAATDAAGNASTASPAGATVTYDATAPTVTINQASGQSDPTSTSPVNFTVTFSETVTGFVTGDVALAGTAGATTATVAGSGTTYNVAISGMTGSGTVIATVAASKAVDAAGNNNAASTSTDNTVTFDATAPTVTVNKTAGQADPTKDSPIDFTVTFSEAVSGFTAADLAFTGSTTGGTLAGVLTPVGSDNTTWTVAVSGMSHNGDVVVSLASAAAQDAVGNSSAASTSTDNTVTYTVTTPLALTTGWNLVAAAPGTTFPGGLWAWEGGSFHSVLDPVAWNGYWYSSATNQNVDMYTVEGPKTFDLTDDWNLIGNSMATPATVTVPQGSGLVVWAWVVVEGTGSFQSVTTLQPGQGGWVKATAGQQLTLTAAGGAPGPLVQFIKPQ